VTKIKVVDAMQRDLSHVILRQRVGGSVRAVRAVRITRVFLTETRVVAAVSAAFRETHVLVISSKLSLDHQ